MTEDKRFYCHSHVSRLLVDLSPWALDVACDSLVAQVGRFLHGEGMSAPHPIHIEERHHADGITLMAMGTAYPTPENNQ